jgi:hypothetical protein
MKNPDYLPPRAADPTADPDSPLAVKDDGSDYDLPVGWTYEHICERDDCRGAVRRPAEGAEWPRYCNPSCEEIVKEREHGRQLPPLNVPR